MEKIISPSVLHFKYSITCISYNCTVLLFELYYWHLCVFKLYYTVCTVHYITGLASARVWRFCVIYSSTPILFIQFIYLFISVYL